MAASESAAPELLAAAEGAAGSVVAGAVIVAAEGGAVASEISGAVKTERNWFTGRTCVAA